VREGAVKAVLGDLALRAVVAQEEIAATDAEVDTEVERLAERLEQKPEKVRRDLERRGVLETVRSDIARGKALEFLIDHATVVDEGGNVIDISLPPELSTDTATEHDATEDADTADQPADESAEERA
jgi:trigger factor